MNGPIAMYKVKPIYDRNYKIEMPNVMYPMKNIHENENVNEKKIDHKGNIDESRIIQQVKKFLQIPINEITALENQQDAILKQLNELKEQLSQMRISLNDNSSTVPKNKNIIKQIHKEIADDIVIKADPKYPPYALVTLLRKWGSNINFTINIFTHSSVCLPDNLNNFFPLNMNGHKSNLQIKVIWKNVGPNMELIISPLKMVTIYGEANIIRFLSRIGPSEQNFELHDQLELIDEVLDQCWILMNLKLIKDRQAVFKKMNILLGKGPFFFSSNTPSIADAVFCSTCINLWTSISKNMTIALKKWFTSTKQYFDIKGAEFKQ